MKFDFIAKVAQFYRLVPSKLTLNNKIDVLFEEITYENWTKFALKICKYK